MTNDTPSTQNERVNSNNPLDCISRQAAIDAAERESQVDGAYGYMDTKSIVDMLNDLPSAQPDRKKGKWLYHESIDVFECSVCGHQMVRNIFNYCPWCGADMRTSE